MRASLSFRSARSRRSCTALPRLAALLLAAASLAKADYSCPVGYTNPPGSSYCYSVYDYNASLAWVDASAHCRTVPFGNLAIIRDDVSANYIVTQGCNTSSFAWIALSDQPPPFLGSPCPANSSAFCRNCTTCWFFDDRSSTAYMLGASGQTLWAFNQPDDCGHILGFSNTGEQCVHNNYLDGGARRLNDAGCAGNGLPCGISVTQACCEAPGVLIPSATPSQTISSSISPSTTRTRSVAASPTASASLSRSVVPSVTGSATLTRSVSTAATVSRTNTASPSLSFSTTAVVTMTRSYTATPSKAASASRSTSASKSQTASVVASLSAAASVTGSSGSSVSVRPTPSSSPSTASSKSGTAVSSPSTASSRSGTKVPSPSAASSRSGSAMSSPSTASSGSGTTTPSVGSTHTTQASPSSSSTVAPSALPTRTSAAGFTLAASSSGIAGGGGDGWSPSPTTTITISASPSNSTNGTAVETLLGIIPPPPPFDWAIVIGGSVGGLVLLCCLLLLLFLLCWRRKRRQEKEGVDERGLTKQQRQAQQSSVRDVLRGRRRSTKLGAASVLSPSEPPLSSSGGKQPFSSMRDLLKTKTTAPRRASVVASLLGGGVYDGGGRGRRPSQAIAGGGGVAPNFRRAAFDPTHAASSEYAPEEEDVGMAEEGAYSVTSEVKVPSSSSGGGVVSARRSSQVLPRGSMVSFASANPMASARGRAAALAEAAPPIPTPLVVGAGNLVRERVLKETVRLKRVSRVRGDTNITAFRKTQATTAAQGESNPDLLATANAAPYNFTATIGRQKKFVPTPKSRRLLQASRAKEDTLEEADEEDEEEGWVDEWKE